MFLRTKLTCVLLVVNPGNSRARFLTALLPYPTQFYKVEEKEKETDRVDGLPVGVKAVVFKTQSHVPAGGPC